MKGEILMYNCYEGKVMENNKGQKFIVKGVNHVRGKCNFFYDIEFVETKYTCVAARASINAGTIKDRYEPSVYGIGYFGDIKNANTPELKKIRSIWRGIIGRCYNKTDKSYNSYGALGVKVCERWHCLEFFSKDIVKIDGYDRELFYSNKLQLDKDIKQKECVNKVYSLETCTFVTPHDNVLAIDRESSKFIIAKNETGNVYEIGNLSKFIKENGLHMSAVYKVLNKDQKNHKGWTFEYINKENDK
jgi:hypothetical protein